MTMNKTKIKLIIAGVLGIICLLTMLVTWRIRARVVGEYRQKTEQKNKGAINFKVAPSAENIFVMKKEYEWLLTREDELDKLLDKKKLPVSTLTPLQFKEELLSAQRKLKQFADIQGCKIEGTLGFSEYASGEIPDKAQVPLLSKQLEVISELVNIILKYKIGEIVAIERLPSIPAENLAVASPSRGITPRRGVPAEQSSGGMKKDLFQETVYIVDIHCTMEELIGILKDVINAPHILVVKSLKVDRLDDASISAELTVGAVEFNYGGQETVNKKDKKIGK